jgi:ribonucleoside-diphosphate reductase beta chain
MAADADDVPVTGSASAGAAAASAGERGALSRRLERSLVPMKLWQAAKKPGMWDPGEIDLKQDREDWNRLTGPERDLLMRLAVQFRGGEGAVSTHLLPLMSVIAGEGRVEEAMYLSSYLWEEAKHIEMFDRFLGDVAMAREDHASYETAAWLRMFGEILRADMHALRSDATPRAQVRAAVTFHLVVEGILGETGYHAYHLILERRGILPGMQRAMQYIKRDESRHLKWGQYLVGRLVAEHGDLMWKLAEGRLAELLEPSLDVVRDVFAAYDVMPFDLRLETFTDFAMTAFRGRLSKLEATRHMKLHELIRSDID